MRAPLDRDPKSCGPNPPDPCRDKPAAWTRIVWVDVESLPLASPPDAARDPLLEVALFVTDDSLRVICCESVVLKAQLPENADPFWLKQHQSSGLLDEVRQNGRELADAEHALFLALNAGLEGTGSSIEGAGGFLPPLAGCSPGLDRDYLTLFMPRIAERLSHRTLDVSCVRNALRAWGGAYPEAAVQYKHRAADDCVYAIEVARRCRGWINWGAKLMAKDKDERAIRESTAAGLRQWEAAQATRRP